MFLILTIKKILKFLIDRKNKIKVLTLLESVAQVLKHFKRVSRNWKRRKIY